MPPTPSNEIEICFLEGPRAGETMRVAGGHTLVGSAPGSDVFLTGSKVMKSHLLIALTEDGYRLYALSPDGTEVDERPVSDSCLIATGCKVRVGDESLLMLTFEAPLLPPSEDDEAVSDATPALRVVVNDPVQGRLDKSFTKARIVVGASDTADVRLRDAEISGRQLVILARGGRYYLYPEGHSPVLLEDRAIEEDEPLPAGRPLRIGRCELTFELLEKGTVSAPLKKSRTEKMPSGGARDSRPSGPRTPHPAQAPVSESSPPPIQLLGVDVRSAGLRWSDTTHFVTFGRHPHCDLSFGDDPTISDLHAVCVWVGKAHVLFDRSDGGETAVNREQLNGRSRTLEHLNVLYMGASRALHYHRLDAPPHFPQPTPDFSLTAVEGPRAGSTFRLKEPIVTIGSHPGSTLPIESPEVAGEHVRIEARGSFGHVFVNLAEEGTMLNGEIVTRSCLLRHEDRIALPGKHELVYRAAVPAPGDLGKLETSRFALRVFAGKKPTRDIPFSNACMLIGNSPVCDVLVPFTGTPGVQLAVVLQGEGWARILPGTGSPLLDADGARRKMPFDVTLNQAFELPGGARLQLIELTDDEPEYPDRTLFVLEKLEPRGRGARLLVSSLRVLFGTTTSCDVQLRPSPAHATAGMSLAKMQAAVQPSAVSGRGQAAYLLTTSGKTFLYPKAGAGVALNGRPCSSPQSLDTGDRIEFLPGEEYRFTQVAAEMGPGAEPDEEGAPIAAPVLYSLLVDAGAAGGSAAGREDITESVLVIGRSEECDLVFPSEHVSRRQLQIVQEGTKFILNNLSEQGTFVGGELTKSKVLRHGDVISFGDSIRLTFQAQESSGEHSPGFRLSSVGGERVGQVLEFQREVVTLGRYSDCDLTFENPSISRVHVEIGFRDGLYRIQPLGSNPLWVNGRVVKEETALADGDELMLPGETRLRFQRLATEMKTVPIRASPDGIAPAASISRAHEIGVPFRLRVVRGPWTKGREFRFCHVAVRIGSDGGCEFQVTDPSVSPIQASVMTVENRLIVQGQGSRPTLLNGAPAEGQTLETGDALQIAPEIEFEILLGASLGDADETAFPDSGIWRVRPWWVAVLVVLVLASAGYWWMR